VLPSQELQSNWLSFVHELALKVVSSRHRRAAKTWRTEYLPHSTGKVYFHPSSIFVGSPLRRFVFLLSCFATAPLAAEPIKLTGEAIKIVVVGSVLELDTPLGTTVSIRFNQDGLMSGDAKELASLLGAATDRGRWWVANDQLCYKWFRWFDAEPRCLAVSQEAKRIFWQRDDGESGTATVVEQAKPPAIPTLEASASARLAGGTSKDAHPANEGELVQTDATALDTRPHFVQADESTQFKQSPQLTVLASKTPLPAKSQSIVANVPVPRLAVRPKPKPTTVTTTNLVKLQPSAKTDIRAFRVAGVDAADVLNIRRGPSQDDESVGEIPSTGHGIIIVGRCLDDWCPIKHGGLTGWVNRYYLAEEDSR
jgi:hypothetical protein